MSRKVASQIVGVLGCNETTLIGDSISSKEIVSRDNMAVEVGVSHTATTQPPHAPQLNNTIVGLDRGHGRAIEVDKNWRRCAPSIVTFCSVSTPHAPSSNRNLPSYPCRRLMLPHGVSRPPPGSNLTVGLSSDWLETLPIRSFRNEFRGKHGMPRHPYLAAHTSSEDM